MDNQSEKKSRRNLSELIENSANDPEQAMVHRKYLMYKEEYVRSFTLTQYMIQKLRGSLINSFVPGAVGWTLLYSSEMHGYSLNTLISQAMKGPSRGCFILSVIEDLCTQSEYERVFGVVFFEKLRYENSSFGTGDTSLFRFRTPREQNMGAGPNALLNIYSANTGIEKRMYIMAKREYLAFGCGSGKFGLRLEKTLLQGESNAVETFNNEVLSHREKFNIRQIELWHVRT
ncbi:hypothetical protein NEMIN01_1207 [Nematocida minor]|uniref:uncharacterized protein n=1 Tax=Nematocida minor TaxID=1912983 RepID=UPI00221F1C12|nr:uncharacterized protein NEMIN01_1207 [Nematocida minor]KAI5190805.1 hypothetical protein NEMIN01_1207 [Nematocida minor]